MSQVPAEREADIARFQELFGAVAPEFTKPVTWSAPDGPQESPYRLVEISGGKRLLSLVGDIRAVFEAKVGEESDIIRVDYEQRYGVNARRQLALHGKSGSLVTGEVRYRIGELEVVLWAGYSATWLLYPSQAEHQLSNANDFEAGILIVKTEDAKDIPPLASMEYTCSQQIPLTAEFPCAGLEDAKKGNYEIRRDRFNSRPAYQTTYFQWENLFGAKVGRTRFKEETGSNLGYHRWLTGINNPEWVPLADTPYTAKITHSPDRHRWGEGRLRFHRKDTETGELWMFSVPEWLDKSKFIIDLQGETLSSLSYNYPVRFWVNQPGQAREEIVTWGSKYDRPH